MRTFSIFITFFKKNYFEITSILSISFFSFFMIVDLIFYPVLASRDFLKTRVTPNTRVFTVRSNAYSTFLGGDILIIREKRNGIREVGRQVYDNDFNHSYEKITGDLLLAPFSKYTNSKQKKLTKQYIAAKQFFCKADDIHVTIERTLVLQNASMKEIKSLNKIKCDESYEK